VRELLSKCKWETIMHNTNMNMYRNINIFDNVKPNPYSKSPVFLQ